jgi:hypothetical protein
VAVFTSSYEARIAIEDALAWLRDEDGWTRDDLDELAVESVERIYEDAT